MAVRWIGLDTLEEDLRDLPAQLGDAAHQIVQYYANRALTDAFNNYPEVTGNLRKGLRLRVIDLSPFGIRMQLRNVAPHADLWENGTVARHTDLGYFRGQMPRPPRHVFVPAASRNRRQMNAALARLLRGKGFTIPGGDSGRWL